MNIPKNKYYIGGTDIADYGLVVTGGSEYLLQLFERKDPYSHDWADENGLEYDLDNAPLFKDRDITLSFALIAISESDFWNKYNQLVDILTTSGWIGLSSVEFDEDFDIFYRSCTIPKRYTRVKNSSYVCMTFDLLFTCKYVDTKDYNYVLEVNSNIIEIGGREILVNYKN